MLLDVLSELDELQIAVAYELDGERIDHFPERCVPAGRAASRSTRRCRAGGRTCRGVRRLADLPAAARRYVDRLAELLGLPVSHCLRGAGSGADDLYAMTGERRAS